MTAALLKALQPEDQDRLLAWRNSPDVSAYMYSDHLISPEEHARWFAGIAGDDRRDYRIIEVDGVPVGLANFYDIDRAQGRASWAFYLADPSVRGRGVGGMVEYLMIERAFGDLGLRKLWCEVLASNEAVWKLHQKFGFTIEARFRHHVVKNGQPQDVVGLGLLAQEWAQARAPILDKLRRMGFNSLPPQGGKGGDGGVRIEPSDNAQEAAPLTLIPFIGGEITPTLPSPLEGEGSARVNVNRHARYGRSVRSGRRRRRGPRIRRGRAWASGPSGARHR
jgi:UDP-4-amino-4,6-dideoxy-N-acetyl-beta-L-altrosamine N-acetyltransferase